MFVNLVFSLCSLIPCAAGGDAAPREPTKADIPAGLPQEIRGLIEKTFSNDVKEQATAADQLGAMGEQAAPAVPFLLRLLATRQTRPRGYSGPSKRALYALIDIGKPAIGPAIGAIKTSPDTKRGEIAFLLSCSLKDPRAVDALLAMLDDPGREARTGAVSAFNRYDAPLDPRAVEPMIRIMKDKKGGLREAATTYFEKARDPRAVEPLIELLGDEYLRLQAAEALGTQRDRRAVPRLVEIWRDTREYAGVRGAAARALAQIGDPQAIEELLVALKGGGASTELREWVAEAVGFSADRRAGEALAAVLKAPREPVRVREAAARAIAHLQGKVAIPLLTQVAQGAHDDPRIRFMAVECIVRLTDGAIDRLEMIDTLVAGVFDQDAYMSSDTGRIAYREESLQDALDKVAHRGKTEAVRAHAVDIIRDRQKAGLFRKDWVPPKVSGEPPAG
jgi:HEAT repeat protein